MYILRIEDDIYTLMSEIRIKIRDPLTSQGDLSDLREKLKCLETTEDCARLYTKAQVEAQIAIENSYPDTGPSLIDHAIRNRMKQLGKL